MLHYVRSGQKESAIEKNLVNTGILDFVMHGRRVNVKLKDVGGYMRMQVAFL